MKRDGGVDNITSRVTKFQEIPGLTISKDEISVKHVEVSILGNKRTTGAVRFSHKQRYAVVVDVEGSCQPVKS